MERLHTIDRRTLLKSAGAAAMGVALGGCARGSASTGLTYVPAAQRRLPRVRVSSERLIRTVVGLRPFRPSGFVVRAERQDSKIIIHNYGHGGGGVTLSWGTAQN